MTSLETEACDLMRIDKELTPWVTFFSVFFFFKSVVCPFSWLFAAFWSWKLLFQLSLQHFGVGTYHFPQNLQHFGGISNILELEAAVSTVFAAFFEFEPFIFDGICNILLIELFM